MLKRKVRWWNFRLLWGLMLMKIPHIESVSTAI